jgi:hypothetical protein
MAGLATCAAQRKFGCRSREQLLRQRSTKSERPESPAKRTKHSALGLGQQALVRVLLSALFRFSLGA